MRGFMGSDRAYDVSGFTQQAPAVLGREDGRKVSFSYLRSRYA